MEDLNKQGRPVQRVADVDWYGFNQEATNRGRVTDQGKAAPQAQGQRPDSGANDPYGYHQGRPATDKGRPTGQPKAGADDPYGYHQGPHTPGAPTHKPGKPGHDGKHDGKHKHPSLTLYDVAESTLKHEGKPIKTQDDIYFRLNDMMVAHGFQKANIDGRNHINDHMLPKSWNDVDPRKLQEAPKPSEPKPEPPKPGKDQPPKDGPVTGDNQPQSPQDKARAEYQKKVEASIIDKFALPPIGADGYYGAVEKLHQDWKPKQILEEARRIRHLNGDKVDLSAGERVLTISKEEHDQMLAKAMKEYDDAQKKAAS